MGLENTNGRMAENTKENINSIKSTGLDSTLGRTVENIMGTGPTVSGTGKEK